MSLNRFSQPPTWGGIPFEQFTDDLGVAQFFNNRAYVSVFESAF
jgi:hypothetical protein